MRTNIETMRDTHSLELKSVLLSIQLADDLFAFKQTLEVANLHDLPPLASQLGVTNDKQGFCTAASLVDARAQRVLTPMELSLYLLEPGARADIAAFGFGGYTESPVKISKTPFDALAADSTITAEDVVTIDLGGHLLFSSGGAPLPVGKVFSYYIGSMNDRCYDLKKALALLNANPRIRFVNDKREPPVAGAGKIRNVPYYSEANCSEFIEFFYEPTPEEALALWTRQVAYGTKYPSTEFHRAAVELDILGLAAAGARLPERPANDESDD